MFAIKKNIESSAELRTSFIFSIIGMCLNNTSFLVIWFSFGTIAAGINGWQPIDAFALLGFSTLSFGLVFTFLGGFKDLPEIVVRGDFDKFLLNPKNVLLRLSTSTITISAIGDIVFGIICLGVWIFYTGLSMQILFSTIFLALLASAFSYFYFLFANTFAFYFQDSRPVVQSVFELYMGPSLMPGGTIQGALRLFFLFVIPSLFAGAYPVEVIKNVSLGGILLPFFVCIFWGIFSVWFFYRSVRKYESSNFINFG